MIDVFSYFVIERESMRIKKESGVSPPYTTDPILANYRFTNINRESDKVTQWIHNNIRVPYADHPNLWLMLCVARWINWPPTLGELMAQGAWPSFETFRPEEMTEVLEARGRRRGTQVFTGVYILRSAFGMSKAKSISEISIGNLWRDRAILAPRTKTTLQEAHESLMNYQFWGPFMSFQVVADLAWCPRLLMNAPDRHTWAAAGPGTVRGLNRLHERPVKFQLSQAQALSELRELHTLLKARIKVKLDPLIDTCNLCCEVDKMLRLRNGEGSVRAKYVAGV